MRTGNAPKAPTCTLARIIAEPMDIEYIKAQSWRDHGILVVSADDPRLGWVEQKIIIEIGRKLYGKGHHVRM